MFCVNSVVKWKLKCTKTENNSARKSINTDQQIARWLASLISIFISLQTLGVLRTMTVDKGEVCSLNKNMELLDLLS